MTVFYETGVATSPADLLGKLGTFIEAHGWVSDPTATASSAGLSNGESSGNAIACGVLATATEWQTRGCERLSSVLAWNNQIGRANVTHTTNWGAGPYVAYHFFVGDEAGNEYVHVTVEVTAGHFRHWALGELCRFGSVTGGVYCDSTWLQDNDNLKNSPDYGGHRHLCDTNQQDQGAHLLVDYDGKVGGTWQAVTNAGVQTSNFHTGINRSNGLIYPLIYVGYQRWNGRTPGQPMMYFANRGSNLRSPIGRMPNIRSINVTRYFPGELVTYGSDTWKVFPVFQKYIGNAPGGITSSGFYGYAHLMP